jgi:teichuronic acid biosynthesis glycosyltransferase TuaC
MHKMNDCPDASEPSLDSKGPGAASGLHVLVVSNHSEVKGTLPFAGIYADRQIASLRAAGLTISTFDIGPSHSPVRLFRKWRELRGAVRRLQPDLVHARYGTVVATLSVLAGRPTVITFCGSDLNSGASVSALRVFAGRVLSNLAALKARRIICVSDGLRKALWWRRSGVTIIPDGVDLEAFVPGSREQARRDLGWDRDQPIVLFNLGDDAKKKGFDLAKAALDVVRSRVPETELKIVQHVEPARMPLHYRAADVLLCTSLNEGSPNVVKEALACNLPVVSVPVGDVVERLAGVRPSAVVPRDPGQLGEALTDVLTTRERSNGREHVATVALPEVAQRVAAVYAAAAAAPSTVERSTEPFGPQSGQLLTCTATTDVRNERQATESGLDR